MMPTFNFPKQECSHPKLRQAQFKGSRKLTATALPASEALGYLSDKAILQKGCFLRMTWAQLIT